MQSVPTPTTRTKWTKRETPWSRFLNKASHSNTRGFAGFAGAFKRWAMRFRPLAGIVALFGFTVASLQDALKAATNLVLGPIARVMRPY